MRVHFKVAGVDLVILRSHPQFPTSDGQAGAASSSQPHTTLIMLKVIDVVMHNTKPLFHDTVPRKLYMHASCIPVFTAAGNANFLEEEKIMAIAKESLPA